MDPTKLMEQVKAQGTSEVAEEPIEVAQDPPTLKDSMPPTEELVTMSKEQLNELLESVRADAAEKIDKALSHVEALRVKYEQQEAESYIKRQGVDRPTPTVNQSRPLGPKDHMDLLSEKHRDKLKGKVARFVTRREEILSLREAQGYQKIKDENGAEVRYMDTVLMAMPKARYQEEIATPIEERRAVNRRAVVERFKSDAERHGIQVEGKGIQYDEGE